MNSSSSSPRPLPDVAPVQLTELAAGTAAQLHAAHLDDEDFALLEALGLTRSCRLRVCKVGDPWIVQIRGMRIGLAASVARQIFVVPDVAR